MTAPASTRRAGPFTGNGVTTSFPFTFKVFAASDLAVVRTSTGGVDTTLALGSHYTVTLNVDQDASPGGTINYPVSGTPLPVGEKLTVVGALPYDQTADLPTGGNYRAAVIETALDRTVMQVQQVAEGLGRALVLPASAATANTTLPAPQPGKVIAWNSAGTGLVNVDSGDLASVVVAGSAYTNIFNGNGSTTAFTLTADPGGVNALDVSISGVTQVNGIDFTVSGTTLTFTSAPPSGTGNVLVRYVASVPVGTASADDITYTHSGSSLGTVGARLRRVVNVKDAPFNAQGDDSTIDTAAIQAAINALDPNVGGIVEFPPGRYIIDNTVEVTRNNVTLRGQRGAVIKLKNNMPLGAAWPWGSMFVAFQKRNVTFEGLTLNGNKAFNDINDNYGNGINIFDSQRVTVRGCHIFACPRDGVTVSDYTRITADAIGNEDIIIEGNLITDCRSPSQTTGGEAIIVVQGNRVVIANNILAGNWRGVEIETLRTTPLYTNCSDITVTGNVCLNNEYGGIGINGADRVILTGNICAGAALYGIRINNSTPITGSEIVVSGNRIKGATVAGLTVENYEQLQLLGNHIQSCTVNLLMSGAKDVQVLGNTISGALQHGVQFTGGTNQNIIFTGNLIRASGQSAANTYDNLTGNANYCVLNANRIDGTSARYGINAAGSSWTIIGNALDNSGTTAVLNDTVSGGARTRDNGGYITEATGLATINSGSTSVVVNHGCSRTPTLGQITVTLGENPTSTAGDIWVSAITSTQFTVNCRNNPGASNLDLGWKVQIV